MGTDCNLSRSGGVGATGTAGKARIDQNRRVEKMARKAGVLGVAVLLAAGCASTPDPAEAQGSPPASAEAEAADERTIWDGVFTSEQASQGQRVAQAECLACHSESEWTTPMFLQVWTGRPIRQLYDNIRFTMPYDAPGRLSREQYAEIIAYILRLNGAEAGDTELPSDDEGLDSIIVTAPVD